MATRVAGTIRVMTRIAGWARRFGVARAVCLVLLFALIPLRLADPRPLEELRVRTFDFFQVLRPRVQKGYPVVIVDIDEASLKAIGQWPWPRTTVADLVTRITQLGALAIGFDVIFAEPDRMSPAIAEQSFRGIDADTRAKLDSLPSNDAGAGRCDQAVACRRRPSRHGGRRPRGPPGEAALQTGFAVRGPDPAPVSGDFSRHACATCRQSKRPRPAAACSRSIPSTTASSAACR